jgi:hypothetical protein
MTLAIIGWIIVGTFAAVIVIAFAVSRMMCPPELFEQSKPPPPPQPAPPKKGAVDLEEYKPGNWK